MLVKKEENPSYPPCYFSSKNSLFFHQKNLEKAVAASIINALIFYKKTMSQSPENTSSSHHYIVIMAGGSGTRLWPLSRKSTPKQFQAFVSEKTMIEETFDRVKNLVPNNHIFVSTTAAYAPLVLEKIPEISQNNIIVEPEARNTAPAMALVATMVHALDSEAVVATIASDHAIENPDEFCTTIKAAFSVVSAHSDRLVTVGINPTKADTGLGYIRMGQEFETVGGKRIFTVAAFKEKPDRETAEQYLRSFDYLWNAGYFIFSTETFSTWTETFAPELHAIMNEIAEAKKSEILTDTLLMKLYRKTASEPIEPLIVEKLSPETRLVIPSALQWSDVGNWQTLYEFLTHKSGQDSIIHADHLDIGSKNLLVHGDKRLIATIGVEDLIIIDTPDALLIARRDQVSGDMKKLIEKLKDQDRSNLL